MHQTVCSHHSTWQLQTRKVYSLANDPEKLKSFIRFLASPLEDSFALEIKSLQDKVLGLFSHLSNLEYAGSSPLAGES
jgi:hypothetical protein